MKWSTQERARLVLCLARGEVYPGEVAAREGVPEAMLEVWVREFLHAAPERFDDAMRNTLVHQGLAPRGQATQQSGRLEDVGPLDLLQSLGIYRRAGRVLFFHPHGVSQLWFQGGQVVDACSGALRGAAAVYRIVGHQQGDFLVEVTGDDRAPQIEPSGPALVFEAARRLDEAQRVGQHLPADDVVLTVPDEALMMRPDLDEPGRQLTALFGPGATVGEVLERSALGELETRMAVAALVESGLLYPTGALRPPQIPSHERRLEALDQLGFTTSPIVTALMHEPLELQPLPERRSWVPALVGGLVAVLVGSGVWLSQRSEPKAPVAAAAVPTLVAPRPAVVGMPAAPPAPISVAAPALVVVPPVAKTSPPAPEETQAQPPPPSPSKRRSQARSKSRTKPSVRSKPQAEAPAKAEPNDAAALLDAAQRAYASGHGAKAYRLASRSGAREPSPEAAQLRVLAACLDGKPAKAHEALAKVSRLRRGKVRRECKREHGVRLDRSRGK